MYMICFEHTDFTTTSQRVWWCCTPLLIDQGTQDVVDQAGCCLGTPTEENTCSRIASGRVSNSIHTEAELFDSNMLYIHCYNTSEGITKCSLL